MIPVEVAGLFILASVILALAPGPDNIFVLVQSALHGRHAGLMVTAGLCTGLLVHTSAVVLGVAVILKTSALAFNLLKAAGAGYLLYLAWQAFHASLKSLDNNQATLLTGLDYYRRGIIMNVSNPKVAIFFLAFLPQFTDPGRGPVTYQVIVLGMLFIISTLLVFGAIALAAGHLGAWLRKSDRVQTALNRMAGTVYLVLAVKLVLSVH